MKTLLKFLIPLLIIMACIVAAFYSLEPVEFVDYPAKTLKSPQQAAAPLGLAVESEKGKFIPEVDSRVHLYNGLTRAAIPVAEHFSSPVGNENGAFTYNAQGFLEPNQKRGGYHLGDDLNGIGGTNSDLGDPVYAAADGLVVYSGKPSDGWGNLVVIAHKLRDGSLAQTFYSHLQYRLISTGVLIGRGQKIGTMGNAGGRYYAHLHYEIRRSDGLHIGGGYSVFSESYGEQVDPTAFIKSYNKLSESDVGKSPLRIILESKLEKAR